MLDLTDILYLILIVGFFHSISKILDVAIAKQQLNEVDRLVRNKFQTFRATITKSRAGDREPTGFEQLLGVGRLIIDMKREGLSFREIVSELSGLGESEPKGET